MDDKRMSEYRAMLRHVKKCLVGYTHTFGTKASIRYSRFDHTKRVVTWTMRLIGKQGGLTIEEQDILITAAIFHDSGYVLCEDTSRHAEKSAEIAREYLTGQGWSSDKVNRVCELVAAHSDKARMRNPDIPRMLLMLMEADLFDDSGAMGIIMDTRIEQARNPQCDFKDALQHIEKYTLRYARRLSPMVTPAARAMWDEKSRMVESFYQSLKADLAYMIDEKEGEEDAEG